MADKKISELPAATTIASDAILPFVEDPGGSPVTKKITLDDFEESLAVANMSDGTATGTGNLVRATSPTLVTPALGTPSALVGTNITGTAAGLTAGAVTGFTPGSGTLTGPASSGVALISGGALGTPSSGNATNLTGTATGLTAGAVTGFTPGAGTLTGPASPGVAVTDTDLGAGVATFLATPSSANLASAVTGETGSGALVFGTSPNITTPTGIVKGDVGLGNVDNTSDATKNSATATLTNKRVTPRVSTESSSATPTINTDNVDAHSITALATDVTSMTTNLSGTPTNFQKLTIRFKDNGTGRAITWGASFEAKGVALPTTTTANKVLTVGFLYDTVALKWGCVAVANET